MRGRASLGAVVLALAAAAVGLPTGAQARSADPFPSGSPWPEMRHDMRNTAESQIRGRHSGAWPWSVKTRRGIFSTPVVDGDGIVYVGSADGSFYAIAPDGRRLWRFRTGGIIDAAAALGAPGRSGDPRVTIGSGDETLYQLRGGPEKLGDGKRVRWRYRTPLVPATGQLVNWWEGNPAYGPDGNLYVGNTGGGVYSLTPAGDQRWIVQRANSVWTTPAFDSAGNSYWGSVDLYAFSLDPAGNQRWQTFTPGYVTSSPALGSDGTVYVGSFDGKLHALDPSTGAERWAFPTADHIYSSAALASGPDGETKAIFIGSADGSVYAVAPDGSELWRYDTGDPVRSSPVLGRTPGGDGRIVYVGSSNGSLYALDAETGERRWSYDTTPGSAALADRNDLNGSPALGKRGVYIGGEHGRVWFVPYDWCRRHEDSRCDTRPGDEFNPDVARMFAVTPGGTTLRGSSERVPPATTLATRLVVRRGGSTVDAAIDQGVQVTSKPGFEFTTELSGDGHFLFIRPNAIVKPSRTYSVRIAGTWASDSDGGTFDKTLRFETERIDRGRPYPTLRDQVPAIELRRLALPEPSLLPSVNQIGFDSYDLIAGEVDRDGGERGKRLMWVIGGRTDARGTTRADPAGGFAFPLYGSYRGNQQALRTSAVSLQFSFGPVPLRSLDFRGATNPDGSFKAGASLYGQVTCADVPNYSAQLRIAGVCNRTDTLASYGTFLSDRYGHGGANAKPAAVRRARIELDPPTAGSDGSATVRLSLEQGERYPASRHLVSVLLVDAATGAPVGLDYRTLTSPAVDSDGNVVGATLRIPAGTELPSTVRAYAIADVYPLASKRIPVGAGE